nr:pescadillo homolog [Tanacetum cinerariifolium]
MKYRYLIVGADPTIGLWRESWITLRVFMTFSSRYGRHLREFKIILTDLLPPPLDRTIFAGLNLQHRQPKHYRPAEKKKEGNVARYVTRSQAVKFIDALQDLDDCLTMVHHFAALPAIERESIQPKRIHNCRGLSLQWQAYISPDTNEERLLYLAYITRIEMVGLILFGPEKARSTLHSVRAPKRIVDDLKCFKSTVQFHILFCFV